MFTLNVRLYKYPVSVTECNRDWNKFVIADFIDNTNKIEYSEFYTKFIFQKYNLKMMSIRNTTYW